MHTVFHFTDKLLVDGRRALLDRQKDEDFDNSIVVTQLDTDEKPHRLEGRRRTTSSPTGMMIYASAATGYRPQAFNPRPFQPTQFVQVDGEEATSYELGFKSDFADNRVRVNLAAFYVDYNQRILPVGGTECTLLNRVRPPYVYNTIPPATGTPIVDSLGNNCVAVTSRTFYINIPGDDSGRRARSAVRAHRGTDDQRASTATRTSRATSATIRACWAIPNVTEITSENPIYVPAGQLEHLVLLQVQRRRQRQSITPRFDYYGQTEICTGIRTNVSVTHDRYDRSAGLLAGLRAAQRAHRVVQPGGHLARGARCHQPDRRGVLPQQVRPVRLRSADAGRSAGCVRASGTSSSSATSTEARVEPGNKGGASGNGRASFISDGRQIHGTRSRTRLRS